LEDWHKLYITAALTSVTLKESAEDKSRKGICRSYDRGYPQGEFKKAKGPGIRGGAVRGNWIEEPVEMS
jgi:hypothetical protein